MTRQISCVGLATVNAKQFKETGSYSPQMKGKCDCREKTTPTQDRLLVRKSKIAPKLYMDLNRKLATSGTDLHVTYYAMQISCSW